MLNMAGMENGRDVGVEVSEGTTGGRRTLGVAHAGGTEISSHPGSHLCPPHKTPTWGDKGQQAKSDGARRGVTRRSDKSLPPT